LLKEVLAFTWRFDSVTVELALDMDPDVPIERRWYLLLRGRLGGSLL
jgi:hypothetical protein